MVPKHRFQTAVYEELFGLLKIAREAEYSWGGKKMSHKMWMYYMKEIIAGDMKLDELARETSRLRREVGLLNASTAENHEQLRQIQVKLLELEWSVLFNGINIRRAIDHAIFLKGTMMAHYLA